MSTPRRISYGFMAVMLLLIGWLHMATLLLTTLFAYFALRQFAQVTRSKFVALIIFGVVGYGIAYGLYYFSKQAYVTFPKIAETTIPAVVNFAEKQGVELPFTDLPSLRVLALTEVRDQFANIGRYARDATFLLIYLIIGIVVAVSLFLSARPGLGDDADAGRDTLYTLTAQEIVTRFRTFYRSFGTVMGAQIIISLINTALTAAFLWWAGFPYAPVLIACTFLCGLLPILGNIISNTLIVGVAFTLSPKIALVALVFLVSIHKLEYFLNSKIIGSRIRNPMWLTLLGLLLGEKLMGIPGMILAPIVLHYIKVEASRNRVPAADVPEETVPLAMEPARSISPSRP